jgi:hypothetical protein
MSSSCVPLVRDPSGVLLACFTFLVGWSSGPGPLFDDVVSTSAATGSGGFASAIAFACFLIFTEPDCFAVAIAFTGVGSGAGVADCFAFPIAFGFVIFTTSGLGTIGLGTDALCFLGGVASSGKSDVLASATAFAAAKASAAAFLFSAWVVWGSGFVFPLMGCCFLVSSLVVVVVVVYAFVLVFCLVIRLGMIWFDLLAWV